MTSGTTSNFDDLKRAVLARSHHTHWSSAVNEWQIVDLEEDPSGAGICVCGQLNLVRLFTIKNSITGQSLFPIGSSCINHFGRTDLNQEVNLLEALAKIRSALQSGRPVSFDTQYFSRALLEWLYDENVFTPDQWNEGDGWNDYDFLLTMFNKRKKDTITSRQRYKLAAIVRNKVFPFVQSYARIK